MSNYTEEIKTSINKNEETPNPDFKENFSESNLDDNRNKTLRCLNCNLIPLLSLSIPSHSINIRCNLGHKSNMNVNQYLQKGLENNFYNKFCSKCKAKIDLKSEKKFSYCKECSDIFCNICIKKHDNMFNKNGGHHHLTLDKFDTTCFIHNESFDYFCKNCNKNICLYCLDDYHRDHDVIDLDDINLKRKEIKRIKENLITEKKNLSLLSDIIHGLLMKFQLEIENILTYKENETKFKESIINTYENKIDNYNNIMNMKKLVFNETAFEIDDNISTWGNISNFFKYVNDTCKKSFSRGRDNMIKRVRGGIEKSVDFIRSRNNLNEFNANFEHFDSINSKKDNIREKKSKQKASKTKVKYHNMSIKTNLEEDESKTSLRYVKKRNPSNMNEDVVNLVDSDKKSEKVKEKEEKKVEEINIQPKNENKKENLESRERKETKEKKERKGTKEKKEKKEEKEKKEKKEEKEKKEKKEEIEKKEKKEEKEKKDKKEEKEKKDKKEEKEKKENNENKENVDNKESMENLRKIEKIESIESIEKLENNENIEKLENVIDIKSIENKEKIENKENKENKENIANLEKEENIENKKNKENIEKKDNKENIEKKDNKENIEKKEIIEKKESKENKKKKGNKENNENLDNTENNISKDIQDFNNNEKNIIVLGKNKDHLGKIQFGDLLFSNDNNNKDSNANNDNDTNNNQDNNDNEESSEYMEQRFHTIGEKKKKKIHKKKKSTKISKNKTEQNEKNNQININKIEDKVEEKIKEIEIPKNIKEDISIKSSSKDEKILTEPNKPNLKQTYPQKPLEPPLEWNTLDKKDDEPIEISSVSKTETSEKNDSKPHKKAKKKTGKLKKGNKTPHVSKKKKEINKKELSIKENNSNSNKKNDEIDYETEIHNFFNVFDKSDVEKKNPQNNDKLLLNLIDSNDNNYNNDNIDNNDIPFSIEESFRHKKIYPKNRKKSDDSFKFDFGNNSNIISSSPSKDNNKQRLIQQIFKDSSYIKHKSSDEGNNSVNNIVDQKQDDESSIIFTEKNKNIINNYNINTSKNSDNHIKRIKNDFRKGGVKLTIKESNNSVCSLLEIKNNIFACGFLFGEIDIYDGNYMSSLFSIVEHKDRINNMYLMKDKSILTSSYDYTMKKIKIDKMDSNEIGPSYNVDFVFDIPGCVIYKGIELNNFDVICISFGGNISIFNKENEKNYTSLKQHEIAEDEIYDVIELTNNQLAFSTDECLRFFDINNYQNIGSIYNIEFKSKNNMKQLNERMLGLLLKTDIGLVDIEVRRLVKKIFIDPVFGKIETLSLLKDKTVLVSITNNKLEEKKNITKLIMKQFKYNGIDKMKFIAENIDEIQKNNRKEYSRISSLIELQNGIIVFSTSEYRDNNLIGTINIIENW